MDDSNPPPSRSLTFKGNVPHDDLFLRVLGPDTAGGMYYVFLTTYDIATDITKAYCRPLHGQARKLSYWDDDKQQWLHHTAMDAEGQLIQT